MSSDYDPWPLADRVQQVERQKRLSVRRAAARAELPATTYYEASRGVKTPTAPTLAKLLRFVGGDPSLILRL